MKDLVRTECTYGIVTLEGYYDDLLHPALANKITKHLMECEVCAARMRRIQERAVGREVTKAFESEEPAQTHTRDDIVQVLGRVVKVKT